MCNCSSKQKQTPLKTAQHSAHNVFSSAITLLITCETSSTATCTTSGWATSAPFGEQHQVDEQHGSYGWKHPYSPHPFALRNTQDLDPSCGFSKSTSRAPCAANNDIWVLYWRTAFPLHGTSEPPCCSKRGSETRALLPASSPPHLARFCCTAYKPGGGSRPKLLSDRIHARSSHQKARASISNRPATLSASVHPNLSSAHTRALTHVVLLHISTSSREWGVHTYSCFI